MDKKLAGRKLEPHDTLDLVAVRSDKENGSKCIIIIFTIDLIKLKRSTVPGNGKSLKALEICQKT